MLALCVSVPATAELVESMSVIPAGTWRPLYPAEGEEEVAVAQFRLDKTPVTNAQYLAFVKQHEQWQRGNTPRLFAGPEYLKHWASPTELGDAETAHPDVPVTHVTWWSARAYCEARGARLPTIREWELAGAASATKADASRDPEFVAQILAWYSQQTKLRPVGESEPNLWGVYDLHGLVWEWVDDFQAELIVVDNRADGTIDPTMFCGAGSISASRKEDYAAFMRSAMRSSLRAENATSSLGFRCAMDGETP